MLRDLLEKIFPLQQKIEVCQNAIYLILSTFGHKLRLRSPRITVLYLQGEGRYMDVRPGTSLFYSGLIFELFFELIFELI